MDGLLPSKVRMLYRLVLEDGRTLGYNFPAVFFFFFSDLFPDKSMHDRDK